MAPLHDRDTSYTGKSPLYVLFFYNSYSLWSFLDHPCMSVLFMQNIGYKNNERTFLASLLGSDHSKLPKKRTDMQN